MIQLATTDHSLLEFPLPTHESLECIADVYWVAQKTAFSTLLNFNSIDIS